ncbi:MAG: hypothetical protein JWO54_941 [Candidatus Saccharibacteria bacterium]|nr:hypothetical protein [Candidatus Saccharibacteria bacterium]MDB5181178.1 hypothetical protein [Candidatus Saccharibacteria bacterium]
MFGKRSRALRREEDIFKAAEIAAATRQNIDEAIQEVLRSTVPLRLYVGRRAVQGSVDFCTVGKTSFLNAEYLLREIERLQSLLGSHYLVEGCVWTTVTKVPFGVAMDIASGYSNPRTYAIEHRTIMVYVTSAEDIKRIDRPYEDLKTSYIQIRKRS